MGKKCGFKDVSLTLCTFVDAIGNIYFSEETFKVKTHIIPVDLNEGRSVYDGIKKGLEGKDIGILGQYSRGEGHRDIRSVPSSDVHSSN